MVSIAVCNDVAEPRRVRRPSRYRGDAFIKFPQISVSLASREVARRAHANKHGNKSLERSLLAKIKNLSSRERLAETQSRKHVCEWKYKYMQTTLRWKRRVIQYLASNGIYSRWIALYLIRRVWRWRWLVKSRNGLSFDQQDVIFNHISRNVRNRVLYSHACDA